MIIDFLQSSAVFASVIAQLFWVCFAQYTITP